MSVEIKTMRDIEAMRVIGRMAGEQLLLIGRSLKAGMTTDDINTIVHEDTLRRGAHPSQLGYHGFPKSVCTSRNEVVCHGIPGRERLKEGDIINVDITSNLNGFHGDTSATFYIGKPSKDARHVTEVCRRALELAIAEVREGARMGDIGAAIQQYAEAQGCSVVRNIVGHGIGRSMHMPPDVSHVGRRGTGLRLKAGMVFTIEPMINLGRPEIETLPDGWTILTKDRSLSAQFEHTVVVTKAGCEILTARHEPLVNSEITESGESLVAPPGASAAVSASL
ncbi:type I methionyl aminopeptidase [Chondromyces crocatus]|uniref:Methionine aminopeptidase n=1 Tax=Chondromyces crocatus TaxID=52 RepID=A0A0K1EHH2_CHOCO|nr:type I methionyl aminopeptidase [Chondromyces crocatus]AKT40117.1 methionine aminopeptidase [Chondromyces crocatus]